MTRRKKRDTSESSWHTLEAPIARAGDGIRRAAVPGGWLYQVARFVSVVGDDALEVEWHPPVFVPGPSGDGV